MTSARAAAIAAGLAAAACAAPAPAPTHAPAALGEPRPRTAAPADAAAPVDASQDEQLAAIQKAMNELAPASQQCWAAAATQRFDIDGDLVARVDVGPPVGVAIVTDTTHAPALATCMRAVLAAYPWAPPLRGQRVQLPFHFDAPDGQNVVDRALVPWAGQAGASVAVLLNRNNSGDDAASMFELALAAGSSTGMRTTPRAEVWYMLAPAEAHGVGAGAPLHVAAGSFLYVPAGGARDVRAAAGELHAMIVVVPGGPEGTARAGALPTPALTAVRSAPIGPTLHAPAAPMAARVIELGAGTAWPTHPDGCAHFLYMLSGAGVLVGDREPLPVSATSVVQLPPGSALHVQATSPVRAVVVDVPACRP